MKKKLERVFIIAEAGCNHNGDLSLAKKLIDAASRAKADAVKFQSFNVDELVTRRAPKAQYARKYTKEFKSQYSMQKKLQLSESNHKELFEYCKKRKIKFLSSSFDMRSTVMLNKLGCKIFKIPSGEITNIPNLELIGSLKKNVILSTGMSTIKEIKKAVDVLKKSGTKLQNIKLLHCTTDYPAKMNEINLRAMCDLNNRFKTDVGYSDHTLGIEASIAAVALGAKIIEKHITINKKLPGPDHHASLNEVEFINLVRSIRNIEKALGKTKKEPEKSELKNLFYVRKSIKAKLEIKKGELFSEKNLYIARPASGLPPSKWKKLIGAMAKKNYQPDNDILD